VNDPVEIMRLGHAGDGVASDGTFIPYTVPGDVVRLAGPPRSHPPEILTAGPTRTAPICGHFGICGGCALQHVETQAYLDWKREQVLGALAQRGFTGIAVEAIRAVGPATRRRAVLKARRTRNGVALGFYEPESRNLVDLAECPVLVPAIANALPRLRSALADLLKPDDTAELHITHTREGLDVSLKWKRKTSADTLVALSVFANAMDLARLVWNGELVALARSPTLEIGGHFVQLPPEPFLQATAEGEAILQSLVREGVGAAKNVADIFSGCGTFGLFLAKGRSIAAFESNAEMLAALSAAARARGSNVTVERRDLFRRPLFPTELTKFDAVVINPPRPGAKAQSEQLARSSVPRVVYVSCNPASFTRDARILADGGFRVARVVPLDQFVWSPHVELVAELTRD